MFDKFSQSQDKEQDKKSRGQKAEETKISHYTSPEMSKRNTIQ